MSECLVARLDGHTGRLRSLLAQLRSVPALADRYASTDAIAGLDDLAKVPVMVKDELHVALAHLRLRAENATAWVLLQSGESTGSPQVGNAPTVLHPAEVHEHWKALDEVSIVGASIGDERTSKIPNLVVRQS